MSFRTLSAGYLHTCGVTTSGAAFCWGDNLQGQLGNGDGSTAKRTAPDAVLGGLTFSAISANQYYTCGIRTGGAAYCWGYNLKGQLGDGTTTDRLFPVAVLGGLSFSSLAPGDGDYHICAVTTGSAAYCWGEGLFGGIGDGTTVPRFTPTLVAGGLSFAAVFSGGSYYTCGRTTVGEAFCWGLNLYGALGDGTNINRLTPVPVQSP